MPQPLSLHFSGMEYAAGLSFFVRIVYLVRHRAPWFTHTRACARRYPVLPLWVGSGVWPLARLMIHPVPHPPQTRLCMASVKRGVVPELVKHTLAHRVENLIEERFRRNLPRQAEMGKELGFAYVAAIYTKWRGRYFYIIARYRNPRENAEKEYFEVRTTRLEYIGQQRFALAYLRHTGKWQEVYPSLSLNECLRAIETEQLFWPID